MYIVSLHKKYRFQRGASQIYIVFTYAVVSLQDVYKRQEESKSEKSKRVETT